MCNTICIYVPIYLPSVLCRALPLWGWQRPLHDFRPFSLPFSFCNVQYLYIYCKNPSKIAFSDRIFALLNHFLSVSAGNTPTCRTVTFFLLISHRFIHNTETFLTGRCPIDFTSVRPYSLQPAGCGNKLQKKPQRSSELKLWNPCG